MRHLVTLVIILLMASALGIGGYFYYDAYYESVGETPVENPVLTVDGVAITAFHSSWTYPIVFQPEGKTISTNYDVPLELFENEGEKLSIDMPAGNDSTATLTLNSEVVSSGSADEVIAFQPTEPGLYSYSITIYQGNEEDGFGSFSYTFDYNLTVPTPPTTILISSTEVSQGEMISVHLYDLPQDVIPTLTSDLGNTLFTEKNGVYTAIIPTGYLVTPGEYSATVTAGSYTELFDINVLPYDYGTQSFNMDTSTSSLADSAAASEEYRANIYPLYDTKDETQYWEGEFLMPAEGRISSEYGLARYINGSFDGYHGGIDIAAPQDTPIIAPNNAKVEFAGFLELSGNTIVLDYGGGLKAYMFHLNSLNCEAGDMVEKGQHIGGIGTTGYSTGNHLHYQLQIDRYAINPWPTLDGSSPIFGDIEAATEIQVANN